MNSRPSSIGRQGLKPSNYSCFDVAAEEVAEKLKILSFRGTLRAEESPIPLTLKAREIPRFARNDKN
jgi:hypothetical protein